MARGGLWRHNAKRDANERPIITGLTTAGISVQQLSGKDVPDLLCGYRRQTYLLEVKPPGKHLKPGQFEWHSWWEGVPVVVVHDLREALIACGIEAGEVEQWMRE